MSSDTESDEEFKTHGPISRPHNPFEVFPFLKLAHVRKTEIEQFRIQRNSEAVLPERVASFFKSNQHTKEQRENVASLYTMARPSPTEEQLLLINYLDDMAPILKPKPKRKKASPKKHEKRVNFKGQAENLPEPVDRMTYEKEVFNPDIGGIKIEHE